MTVANILNQGRLIAEIGLVALPMTLVIVTGGIDLAVGSVLGLCAIVLGLAWKSLGLPLGAAMAVAVGVGALAGCFNGLLITRMRVPPLITTLATLALFRGLAEGLSQARSVRGYPEWFFFLGQGEIAGVPVQVIILVAMAGAVLVPAGEDDAGPQPVTRSAATRSRRATPASRSTASRSWPTACRA